jgi:membrane associated rhomboid family serine protease
MLQPWSLITYMFMHDSFFHILFNMLWLYWIGGILQEYLGNRKVIESYLSGGIFGGLLYIITYNLFPVFKDQISFTYAIGASAGVLAVVVATATLLPDYAISLLFFGPVKLKYLALISIVLDFISIPNGNAGGHIAHIGGALAGFLFIRYLYQRGGHLFPDKLFNLFEKKPNFKVHSGNKMKGHTVNITSQQEIDAILDKISKSGYDSLSKKEKEILFKASKD